MDFVKAATIEEFEDISHKVIKLIGRPVGIIKRDDGTFFGIEASCKHQGADLLADYRGGTVAVCPRHQWEYDLETGRCLNHDSLPLKRYEVKLEGADVLVSMLPIREEVTPEIDFDRLK
jgi:nitrite reductase/ring-hydroxylating ferredoxin subunit